MKLKPVFNAISTPIGLPTELIADPLLQAKTSMITNGAGVSLYLFVRCSMAPAMNRMAVTSPTSAEAREAKIIMVISSNCGRGPTVLTMAPTTCSKNRLSSRKPITRNVPMRNTSTSRLAAWVKRSTVSRLHAISRAIPPKAKASRNSP